MNEGVVVVRVGDMKGKGTSVGVMGRGARVMDHELAGETSLNWAPKTRQNTHRNEESEE